MNKRTNRRIRELMNETREALEQEASVPLSVRDAVENLVDAVGHILEHLGQHSGNSHVPPSKDIGRSKGGKKDKEKKSKERDSRKVGGQPGHEGNYLPLSDTPDVVIDIPVESVSLARTGMDMYVSIEPERRQVIDFEITRIITEYRAQQLYSPITGVTYTASFPPEVKSPTQYGNGLRAHVIGLTCRQSVPYERVSEQLDKEYGIPVSTGSMVNWEKLLASQLKLSFVPWAKAQLTASPVCHFDETGINIAGETQWAHESTNGKVVLFFPHQRRGQKAMDAFGILPNFRGIGIHDHWNSYFRYTHCLHALCNAHHVRELEKIAEDPAQAWASDIKGLLIEMRDRKAVHNGLVPDSEVEQLKARYDTLVRQGLHKNPGTKKKGKRRSKARCLLDRLNDSKEEVLRFLTNPLVPFTNNDAERPIRMLKVEMKISGTFRSFTTAEDSLTIRSYILTCQNHGISPYHAIRMALAKQYPQFITNP